MYVYHNNDIVTVRNWPADQATLKISKTFNGNVELTDAQKAQVTFTLQKKNGSSWEDYPIDVWDTTTSVEYPNGRRVSKATLTYGDSAAVKTEDEGIYEKGGLLFKNGVLTIEAVISGSCFC